jgi:pyridoxamine 5'-phosphate oxidase
MDLRQQLRALTSLAGPFPGLDADAAPDNPRELFARWLREAIEAGIREPHAMVLSTVDEAGAADARVVILKNLDDRGWHFASTNSGPKGRQIAIKPYVALTFYWPQLGRQVRLRGVALPTGRTERDADFLARPAASRAAALVARQSQVLASTQDRDDGLRQQRRRLAQTPDLIAPDWAVFIVMPHQVEFWQGDEERRHERVRYRLEKAGWTRDRLWP